MSFSVTVLFYLLIGVAVAVAVWLRGDLTPAGLWFRSATAVCFWPIYLPLLLQPPSVVPEQSFAAAAQSAPRDDMAQALAQVEAELDAALGSLNGWSEALLADEHDRFAELKAAWRHQADRIRELDELLTRRGFAELTSREQGGAYEVGDEVRSCIDTQTRRENLQRLRDVRMKMHNDLMGTLAWVRELVTMIHLARFTGAPASRAAELVAQIAAAVEGLSEVTHWSDESHTLVAS